MSQLHLATGSQQPPKVEGKLRLYSMEYCPYAQRTRLVLNAKKIPYDIVNINLQQKPEWYFKLNPEGKVPALDTGSQVIIESLIISDFLDDNYPDPPLYPKDPNAKKHDKALIEKISLVTDAYYGIVLRKEEKSREEWIDEMSIALREFESELASRGTPFFGGDKPGMVDYMIWPWGERLCVVQDLLDQNLGNLFPLLEKWSGGMKEDPAAKPIYHNVEVHRNYNEKRRKGEYIDYDNLE